VLSVASALIRGSICIRRLVLGALAAFRPSGTSLWFHNTPLARFATLLCTITTVDDDGFMYIDRTYAVEALGLGFLRWCTSIHWGFGDLVR